MTELETIKELANYTLIESFKKRSFFDLFVFHYFYKGKKYNVHISWCKHGTFKTWVISYGTGNDIKTYKENIGSLYRTTSKQEAIQIAKKWLEVK